jgi:uncharacterized DUF497 family protein
MGRGQSGGQSRGAWRQFHGAAQALDDPRKIETVDDRFDYGEERIQSLCMGRGEVLFVVTVMPDENICRIISARKGCTT